jgi:hypothetical protein
MTHATDLFRVARQAKQVCKNLALCGEAQLPAPPSVLGVAAQGF